MQRFERFSLVTMLAASLCMSACQGDDSGAPMPSSQETIAGKPAPAIGESSSQSPGKPSAPVSMQYEVVGNAIVGQPVLINVAIKSNQGPVNVQYSITDGSAVVFQRDQVKSLEITEAKTGDVQQLSVIPQREGRVYVNVSAEVQTPAGTMIRSMAIPIKVGSAPEQPDVNGELKEGPDGETVISMPAQQSN